jgi:endonuclease-3 related protein
VIDEYTKRIAKREKLSQNLSYDYLQEFFQNNPKRDFRVYQDFHALLVIEGQISLLT